MNASRRKEIQVVSEKAGNLLDPLRELKTTLESIKAEEQDYFDSLSESVAEGDKGTASEEAIETIEAAIDCLDTIIDDFDEKVVNLSVE
jgi:uncharacterized coiled-coil DUF342 family protein